MIDRVLRQSGGVGSGGGGARGFTLIEVLLAAFILALGVLGLAALFAGGARQQQLASETTRSTAFNEAGRAWEGSFGVMSSFDRNGNGTADFDEVIDVGRWYALSTQAETGGDGYFDGRVALVSREGNTVNAYPDSPGGTGIEDFQPFFRKVVEGPFVLYSRRPAWSPRQNDDGDLADPGAFAEASFPAASAADAGATEYFPQNGASPFLVSPYQNHDPSPSADETSFDVFRGPAFLPDRAILPESVELTVRYFEYDSAVDVSQPVAAGDFEPFSVPAFGPPRGDLRGRVLPLDDSGRFGWVDPLTPIVRQRVNSNEWVAPRNELINGVLDPGVGDLRFPDREVWEPEFGVNDGDDPDPDRANTYTYGVYMPYGGSYVDFDLGGVNSGLPLEYGVSKRRPAYLVLFLAPDFDATGEERDPRPTIVQYELGGVLDSDFDLLDAAGGLPVNGPERSVEEIRVDRYVARVERMPSSSTRVLTVADSTQPDGVREVVGYATLYRRTQDGQGEVAVFGYRLTGTSASGVFEPFESPDDYGVAGNSVLTSTSFRLRFDTNRNQFYVVANEAGFDWAIAPGQLLLFAGPEADDADVSEVAPGADNGVRVTARVRVNGEQRGYLDDVPRYRGQPLVDVFNGPGADLMAWHIRDRVRSELNQAVFNLEPLEVRVSPVRE